MSNLVALAAVGLAAAASVGLGATLLRACGVFDRIGPIEQRAWAFGLGWAGLGWLLFFVGVANALSAVAFAAILAISAAGFFVVRGRWKPFDDSALGPIGRTAAAVIAVSVAFDVIQAFAPQADADTLAYHLQLPKTWLAAGRLVFTPRALDGAAPFLPHMTYTALFGLAGETAASLWFMVLGWGSAAVVYGAARRYLPVDVALGFGAIFKTVPAVIYGAGNGQVEVKLAGLALIAALAVSDARKDKAWSYAAVAGIAAGFFIASKYTGLLFAGAIALTLLVWSQRPAAVAIFAIAAVIAGAQWMTWNYWLTGDPVFPILYGAVDYRPGVPWNAAQHAAFAAVQRDESAVSRDLFWLLAYPFKATLDPAPIFESDRTGFGPYPLLLLPLVLLGAWRTRERLLAHPLAPVAAIVAGYYALWFFLGPSQRVRHSLPVQPLLLLCLTVAAYKVRTGTRGLLEAAAGITLCIQLAGGSLLTWKYVRWFASPEDRQAFLAANVANYAPVPWINANLGKSDKLFLDQRQLLYAIDVPVLLGHAQLAAEVEIRNDNTDAGLFFRQLRARGATHLLAREPTPGEVAGLAGLTGQLVRAGCAAPLRNFDGRYFTSRTVKSLGGGSLRLSVFELANDCALGRPGRL